MATGKALNGKPYAGNPHVRFDEGEVASCTAEASLRREPCRRQPEGCASRCAAMPSRGSLLYKMGKPRETGRFGGRKLTAHLAVAISCAVALVAASSPAKEARYAMPVYSMGNYFPSKPSISVMVTTSPRLAFKGIDLDELRRMVDDGWEIFARMCGGFIGDDRKSLVPCYNLQFYPQSGTLEKIVGDFAVVRHTPANCQSLCVEFSNSEEGVCVRALDARYLATTDESYKFVTLGSDGTVTFAGEHNAIATGWTVNGYGSGAVQCAKFVPASSTTLAFEGTTLDEIKDYDFSGCLGGASERHGLPCRGYNKRILRDGDSIVGIVVEMQALSGDDCRCAVVKFTDGEGGVHAQTLAALTSQEELGYVFDNNDGTYNGTPISIATSYAANSGLGVYGLTATAPAHDMEADAYIPSGSSVLVWRGVTLDDVKDHWLGCRFRSGYMTDSEGRGCNIKVLESGGDGSILKMRVEFQKLNGTTVQCVVVELSNGADGVYAKALSGRYKSGGEVGYRFVNDNGTYNGDSIGGISTSATGAGYGIYRIFALPCTTLSQDEDWSAFGCLDFGGGVIDLNGHALTAEGLSFDQSHVAQLVNAKTDTTGEMRFYVFEGGIFTNDCLHICKPLIKPATGEVNGSLGADNIKVVKDGKGMLVSVFTNQLYTGGTEIVAGSLSVVDNGRYLSLGKSGSEIKVDAGAEFFTGQGINFGDYLFVLDGGTLRSGRDNTGSVGFKDVKLVADSTFDFPFTWPILGSAYTATRLDLGGHTLTVKIANGKDFRLCNATVTTGTIDIVSGGTFYTYTTASTAKDTDFRINCGLKMDRNLSVRNYEALWNKTSGNSGTAKLDVYGVFKPMNAVGAYYGCTMQDGSAIDFVGWPAGLGWPMYSRATSGDTKLKFAAGATVTLKLADRADIWQLAREKTYILKWGDEFGTEEPANVTFVLEESLYNAKCRIEKDQTGLRLVKRSGLTIIVN